MQKKRKERALNVPLKEQLQWYQKQLVKMNSRWKTCKDIADWKKGGKKFQRQKN